MRKHILIPTDFSENAWNALQYATTLYRRTECTFYLLHAFHLFHFPSDEIVNIQPEEKEYVEEREASEKELQKLIKTVKSTQDHRNHQFKMISSYKTVLDAVKQAVTENPISIIVIGTKGKTNPGNVLYGSNAIDIINNVTYYPVLVIPEKSSLPEGVLREIVFATHFKYSNEKIELNPLIDLAKFYKAVIRVLHITNSKKLTEEQEKNKEALKIIFDDLLNSFHTMDNIKVNPGIHSFIEDRSSNLLVIYNRENGLLSGLFSNSLVKEMDKMPQIPLLVLKEKQL